MPRLVAIHRHPIKGFTAENLEDVNLQPGQGLPLDRHFAFVSGRKEGQPIRGGWVQSRTFLMLTLFPELAQFDCRLNDSDDRLTITDPNGQSAVVTVGEPETFAQANRLIREHFDDGPHGQPRLVEQSPGYGHWDFSDTAMSIINLATLRIVSEVVGRDLEKERFRGNLYIDGLDPWEEFSWPGCRARVGDTELDVLRPIQRCAMTSTEPGTGVRAIDVPKAMMDTFGHHFCGVYARVVKGGMIGVDSVIDVVKRDVFNPHECLPERAAAPALWPRFVSGGDWDSGYANYASPAKNWPLLEVEEGQTIRNHPLTSDGALTRTAISHSTRDGWFVTRQSTLGPLVSGPYGRTKT